MPFPSKEEILCRPNALLWSAEKDGALYRRCLFDYECGKELHWMHAIDLADLSVPEGIIRADRIRLKPCRRTTFPVRNSRRSFIGIGDFFLISGHKHRGADIPDMAKYPV